MSRTYRIPMRSVTRHTRADGSQQSTNRLGGRFDDKAPADGLGAAGAFDEAAPMPELSEISARADRLNTEVRAESLRLARARLAAQLGEREEATILVEGSAVRDSDGTRLQDGVRHSAILVAQAYGEVKAGESAKVIIARSTVIELGVETADGDYWSAPDYPADADALQDAANLVPKINALTAQADRLSNVRVLALLADHNDAYQDGGAFQPYLTETGSIQLRIIGGPEHGGSLAGTDIVDTPAKRTDIGYPTAVVRDGDTFEVTTSTLDAENFLSTATERFNWRTPGDVEVEDVQGVR